MPSGSEAAGDLRRPPLIGRSSALAELSEALEHSISGRFRVLLIEGDAAVGKTRLMDELLAHHGEGTTSLVGRSYRWGGTTSFGPWVEAIDGHLARGTTTDPVRLESLRLLAGRLKGSEATLVPLRRHHMLDALVELLAALGAEGPVLVGLDDIHLADASSWEGLRYISRRLADAPLGIVATARTGELRRHPIAVEVLLGLREEGLARVVTVDPLTEDDVGELVRHLLPRGGGRLVPEGLVRWLYQRSLGHPLFVITLMRALVEEQADLSSPELRRIPETIRDRVGLEVKALDAAGSQLLELLAVTDRRTRLGELGRMTGQPSDRLAEALEDLAASHLVTELEEGSDLGYEIAHPLIQEAVYQNMGGARRRRVHRMVGETLLEEGRLGTAAAHFARGAEVGDDRAVDVLCRAMRQAEEQGLYQEALATMAATLEVLPAGDRRWLQVLEAMQWQADWVIGHLAEGEVDVAIGAMKRIRPLAEGEGDASALATVDLHLAAFLSIGAGNLEEAERACRSAIEGFDRLGDGERALIARNELAWVRACAGHLEESTTLAAQVAGAAEEAGYLRPAVHALGISGYLQSRMGRFRAAGNSLRRSIDLARSYDDSYRVAWNRNHLGMSLILSGGPDEGMAMIEAALEEDPASPDAGTLVYLAHGDWLRGRLRSAVAWVEQSEARRLMQGSRRRGWALAVAARAYAEMGQESRARRRVERARAIYGGRQILDWDFWCDWADGILAWHNGEPARGLRLLASATEWLGQIGAVAYEGLVLVDTAELAADGAEGDRALDAADRLAAIAGSVDGDLYPALSALSWAWSHLVGGRLDDAAGAAERAADGLAGYELYRAGAVEAWGRSVAADDGRQATSLLREAAAAYHGCGATWRRDRVLARLNGLGAQGRRAAASVLGPASLTERERQVAALAARGYTAWETGERLFISRRTVETHLASVYSKLGVASKRELIRQASDLGLDA